MNHPSELTLRRHLAGEALPPDVVDHLGGCTDCGGRVERLREEQRQFEAQVPFDRFAAGVERAVRQQQRPAPRRWAPRALALAAVAILAVGSAWLTLEKEPQARLKGGPTVDFVIAGAHGQRSAGELEPLAAGERVRIGVHGGHYVAAASVDEHGEVSSLYDQAVGAEGRVWLPDSLEFTGAGREHVVVLVSDAPIDAQGLNAALLQQYAASKGDLEHLGLLQLPGVQVHRTFIKP